MRCLCLKRQTSDFIYGGLVYGSSLFPKLFTPPWRHGGSCGFCFAGMSATAVIYARICGLLLVVACAAFAGGYAVRGGRKMSGAQPPSDARGASQPAAAKTLFGGQFGVAQRLPGGIVPQVANEHQMHAAIQRPLHDSALRGRGRSHTAAHGRMLGEAFKFGYQYTHFFYVLSPRPPHQLLGSSGELCLASAQDPTDCESVQFVSGLVLAHAHPNGSVTPARTAWPAPPSRLLLSYGVNDCEARLAEIPLARVWELLSPLPGMANACAPPPESSEG